MCEAIKLTTSGKLNKTSARLAVNCILYINCIIPVGKVSVHIVCVHLEKTDCI